MINIVYSGKIKNMSNLDRLSKDIMKISEKLCWHAEIINNFRIKSPWDCFRYNSLLNVENIFFRGVLIKNEFFNTPVYFTFDEEGFLLDPLNKFLCLKNCLYPENAWNCVQEKLNSMIVHIVIIGLFSYDGSNYTFWLLR